MSESKFKSDDVVRDPRFKRIHTDPVRQPLIISCAVETKRTHGFPVVRRHLLLAEISKTTQGSEKGENRQSFQGHV